MSRTKLPVNPHSGLACFNGRNKSLTAKLLQQGYRYHKLRKTFSKFYCRHFELVSKFNVGLKTLLHQGLSEPEYCGDLYGTPEGTFSFLFLSCAHRLLTRFNNIITRLNDLLCRTQKLIIVF